MARTAKATKTAKLEPEPDRLEIRYIPLETAVLWDENPKQHDRDGIKESIRRHGFRDAPIYDQTLGALVAGNGRTKCLVEMKRDGEELPRGIAMDEHSHWCVPVQFGVDATSREAAESFAVDHNNLTLAGGGLGAYEMAAIWDEQQYRDLLVRLDKEEFRPVSVSEDDFRLLLEGVQFPEGRLGDDQGTHAARITIRIEAPEYLDAALEDVAALIDQHPEWKAVVTRR
jgi:hypothetical protein